MISPFLTQDCFSFRIVLTKNPSVIELPWKQEQVHLSPITHWIRLQLGKQCFFKLKFGYQLEIFMFNSLHKKHMKKKITISNFIIWSLKEPFHFISVCCLFSVLNEKSFENNLFPLHLSGDWTASKNHTWWMFKIHMIHFLYIICMYLSVWGMPCLSVGRISTKIISR